MINRKTIENKITQTFKYKSTIVVQIYLGTYDQAIYTPMDILPIQMNGCVHI